MNHFGGLVRPTQCPKLVIFGVKILSEALKRQSTSKVAKKYKGWTVMANPRIDITWFWNLTPRVNSIYLEIFEKMNHFGGLVRPTQCPKLVIKICATPTA
jgi:hypothetical protein